MKKIALVLALITGTTAFAQDRMDSKHGKGIVHAVAADSSFSVKFNIRMQQLFTADADLDGDFQDGDISTNFFTRRARLKFGGFAFSPKITYKMEIGLSNRDFGGANGFTNNADKMILDAVVKWNFYKNMSVWVGQTKLPGNRERVISSQNLQFVDRSQLNSRFNIDRDQGIQLHNHHSVNGMVIREAFAISQGEGRNITSGNRNGFEYTGRVEFLPFGNFTSKGDYFGSDLKREKDHKLSIGVTYDFNNGAQNQRGNLGSSMSTPTDLSTVFVDAMYKYNGWSVMTEFAHKSASDPAAYLTDTSAAIVTGYYYTGNGISAQVGYLFKNNIELAGRVTMVNPEDVTGRANYNEYTLGVSRYISGHNLKIQSDITLRQTEGGDDNLMFRLQVELGL
ncbi:MAG: phosphate-selective porin OprO/OprP [Flavobacteriales bacterium]|jgi:phosphate-selective porin OprO/OprP